MRRMYSENQLAKIIADNAGKATSLLGGALELDDNTIIANTLLSVVGIQLEGNTFDTIEDEDGNTLQEALDNKAEVDDLPHLYKVRLDVIFSNADSDEFVVFIDLPKYEDITVNDLYAGAIIKDVNNGGFGFILDVLPSSIIFETHDGNSKTLSKSDVSEILVDMYHQIF